ncbi:DEAD/DEAH box helicase [Niabella insulamsoli]|uniref:DEAD/DEAH box helicase n=1 Tax=Niabella insulamsoli TaxID=3144874 RepID=UPI0031FC3B60
MATAHTKNFLLFQPAHLFSKKPVIALRQLIKTPEGLQSGEQPLTRAALRSCFKALDEEAQKSLLRFSAGELEKTMIALHQEAHYLAGDKEKQQLVQNALQKKLYSWVGGLRRLAFSDWYHAVQMGDKRFQNMKCSFYHYPVEAAFDIIKTDAALFVTIHVEIGKEKIDLDNFRRFYFLLERDDCYYQLSQKSHEALHWFLTNSKTEWGEHESKALAADFQQLEQWEVRVDRSALSEASSLSMLPKVQLLLSELNNTFLKLEPQFVYDGFIVEGVFEPVANVQMGDRMVRIERSEGSEQELVGFLRSLHEKFANQNNGFFYLTFAEAQKKGWFLKTYHTLLEKDIDLVGIDLLKHFRYSPHKAEIKVTHQKEEGDFIMLQMELSFGKDKVTLTTLQKALLNNQKAVMLKDGSLGVLGEDWIRKYGLLIKHGKIKDNQLRAAKWLMLGDITSAERTDEPLPNQIGEDWIQKWHQWEKRQASIFPLPSGLKVPALRSYQQSGYEWLRLLSEIGASGCLADDMGLGKTLQTISFILYKMEQYPESKHLVVAPASLLYNWLKELEKFAPGAKAIILHGAKRDTAQLLEQGSCIVITSYGTMRQDLPLLESVAWETIVLDESHHIKNPAAQTTRAVWQLTAKTKIAISGTPVMNNTSDLHSQLHFLMPGLLGTPEFFKKEYAIPIEQQANEEKAAALQRLIRPFVLRRTKEQVAADLPDRTESVLWCEMNADQRSAYESIKEEVRANIFTEIKTSGLNKGKLSVLAGLTKLRQVCNSGELVKHEDIFTYESVKTKVLIDELKCIIPEHNALVFSQFTTMLDLLERDLKKEGIATLRLDGQTDIKKRQELVNTFQAADATASVFLISLKAGNTGLNLTKADYVFLFDPWWNTAVENQAIDRTHRIGQRNQVFAYRMICRDSIEEKIIKLAGRKKKLADDLISTDENVMKALTIEDIQFLLE